ncbi:uncharacterized protein LOC103512469 [Diaphorina citri]|uniref:Uncharacterized protein LOC103512469 n=1 Tax=Diaphorina citri TaxID=121845 RepID=A0A3Q0IZV4_DIACI|nr:uncharacterized protein LOC103512469 [Diaphorina citri]
MAAVPPWLTIKLGTLSLSVCPLLKSFVFSLTDSNSTRRHLVPSESGNLVTSPLLTLSETESPDTNESRHPDHHNLEPLHSKLPPSQRHSLKLSQLHAIDMNGPDSDSNSHCGLLLHESSVGGETPKKIPEKFPSHADASTMIGFIRGNSASGTTRTLGNARASRSLNSRSSSYELSDLRKTHM